MRFDDCVTLESMMGQAQKRFADVESQIDSVSGTLSDRLGGNSRGTLIRGVFASVAWGVLYCSIYAGMKYYGVLTADQLLFPYVTLATLALSLALAVLMVIGGFTQMRYYGVILSARDRLTALRRRLEIGKNAMPANRNALLESRASQWELPLTPGDSISEETMAIAAQLSGLEALSGGLLSRAKIIFYYLACIAWTVTGSCALYGMFGFSMISSLEPDTNRVILIIAILISCVGNLLIAKLLWGKTGCAVTNLTLFATLLGPLVFAALAIVVGLVIIVVQLVLAIAAVIIAGFCLIGSLSGG